MKKILYTIVILGAATGFFLFSAPGLDILKKAPDSNREATWAPFMYYNIARLHESMGRHDTAVEIYDEMLKTYDRDRRRSGQFVEHDLSRHYVPYALYRKGICLKKMGDKEYARASAQRSEGKSKEAEESAALSEKYHTQACRIFREFIDKYVRHKLYPEANRLYNELQINLSS